ncbi:diguanylate cyclase [uncultured Marinobacter sp.]|nr:diguanylate cyclase [uncultured Marinobacter sp.]
MARRLRTVLREEDTLARLGGDEFAAMYQAKNTGRNGYCGFSGTGS